MDPVRSSSGRRVGGEPSVSRIGLVLGGGGAVGHGFHSGVLAALEDVVGFDARTAEVIVGTSGGATIAGLVRAGVTGTDLASTVTRGRPSPRWERLERRRGARSTTPPARAPRRPPACVHAGVARAACGRSPFAPCELAGDHHERPAPGRSRSDRLDRGSADQPVPGRVADGARCGSPRSTSTRVSGCCSDATAARRPTCRPPSPRPVRCPGGSRQWSSTTLGTSTGRCGRRPTPMPWTASNSTS